MRIRITSRIVFLCAAIALALTGCGYHVGGRGSALPANLHTIAVPAFVNKTPSYRLEQKLTGAVIHEFLTRTSYRTVTDPASADAVLHGEVSSIESVVATYDSVTGRATTMLVTVHLKVWLENSDDKKELYRNNDFVFRQPYEISTDVNSFFNEQSPALDRLCGDFARALVSAILEKF
ncbi:MAG: LptE family protein [Candidatus Acidiferrales bacterium]